MMKSRSTVRLLRHIAHSAVHQRSGAHRQDQMKAVSCLCFLYIVPRLGGSKAYIVKHETRFEAKTIYTTDCTEVLKESKRQKKKELVMVDWSKRENKAKKSVPEPQKKQNGKEKKGNSA